MTREDAKKAAEVLLKDLCARIPYEVVGKCELDASYDTSFDTIFQTHKFDAIVYGITEDLLLVHPLIEDRDEEEFANEEVIKGIDILDFKPYLFPLSSMTEEEWEDYQKIRMVDWVQGDINGTFINAGSIVDWLNAHHFDYRGLIEKGLAIDATGLNIYIKDRCCEEDDRDPNFLPEQYHVKKEPSRPFHNAEECLNEMMKHQPFGWVYDKNNNQFLNTNRVGNDGVDFYGRQRNTFAKANSYITFADKEPFGIKE